MVRPERRDGLAGEGPVRVSSRRAVADSGREERSDQAQRSVEAFEREGSKSAGRNNVRDARDAHEEVIRDNLDLGRPDRVVTEKTPEPIRTRVIQDGVHPSLHIQLQELRFEAIFQRRSRVSHRRHVREPNDFGINKGLSNPPYLQKIGREINRRLLEVEHVSHNCGLSGDSIQRVVQPTVTEDGEKAPALKFGQPRVMALLAALTLFQHLIDGFHNLELRLMSSIYWARRPTSTERLDFPDSQDQPLFRHFLCRPSVPASRSPSRGRFSA